DAYRTLRHPISRVEYLLKLEGLAPQGREQASKQVPAGLLEEVFALNEELDDVREQRSSGAPADVWKGRRGRAGTAAVGVRADAGEGGPEGAGQPIEAKRPEHEAQLKELSARWDATGDRTVL